MNRFSGFPRAFTFVELLALVAVLALLVLLAAPAICKTRPNGRALQCLNNQRRLIAAWQIYTQDNHDRFVTVLHGNAALGGAGDPVYGKGWASGWLDWTARPDNTNLLFLIDERYAKLAKYVNRAANIFKCPADSFLAPYQSHLGWTMRARSYSINAAVGEGNAEAGPWDYLYKHIYKTSDFLYPGPAETFVFLDEHPDSINDPGFFSPHQSSWIDLPGTYHNGGGAFAFGDGRAEIHKWIGSLAPLRGVNGTFSWPPVIPGDADIRWMSFHSPRVSANSY